MQSEKFTLQKNEKMRYCVLLGCIFISLSSFAFTQAGKAKRGERYFNKYSYLKAIEEFEQIREKDENIYRYLAQSHYKIRDYANAETYFALLLASPKHTADDVYYYASVLKNNGKHAQADQWMLKFHDLKPTDTRGIEHFNNQGFYKDSISAFEFSVKNLSMNTKESDFGPAFFADKIVFASTRRHVLPVKRLWNWNNLGYLDLWVATRDSLDELFDIKQFDPNLNKKYHEGPACFNAAGDTMIYTVSNYSKKNTDGIVRIALFSMERIDGKWQNKKALDFNNNTYSTGHAALSSNGESLYFSSDMPGGYGGTDIYKSLKRDDDSWGNPENLGAKINTEGNESFPFLHEDGELLFFSSDGRLGLGGADIFVAHLEDGRVGAVENLKAPVNSNRDDFTFILNKEKDKGFFASNRAGGAGSDDLYAFVLPEPFDFPGCTELQLSNLLVRDEETEKALADVGVVLINNCTQQELLNTQTQADGVIVETIDCKQIKPECTYELCLEKEGYVSKQLLVNIEKEDNTQAYLSSSSDLSLRQMTQEDTLPQSADCLPIYFDFDKFTLRKTALPELDKLVKILKEQPQAQLEIRAHTDYRGAAAFNRLLSEKRADAAVEYIVEQGIDTSRIISKGYGETQPAVVDEELRAKIPTLTLGQVLTEAYIKEFKRNYEIMKTLNQYNRRVEFRVSFE